MSLIDIINKHLKQSAVPKTASSTNNVFGAIATTAPKYFYADTGGGSTLGYSQTEKDTTGRPFFAYRKKGDTATTTDKTRVATEFDPRQPQPVTRETFTNPRFVANKEQIRQELGSAYSDVIDHKMALALSGSNNPENLRSIPSEENKDGQLASTLADEIISGKKSLFDAQVEFAKAKGIEVPYTGKSSFLDTLKGIGEKVLQGTIGVGEKISSVVPGVRAEIDAITQGSVEPLKQYIKGLPKQIENTFGITPEFKALQEKYKGQTWQQIPEEDKKQILRETYNQAEKTAFIASGEAPKDVNVAKTVFHGTPYKIEGKLSTKFGGSNMENEQGVIFFTDNKKIAEKYSQLPQTENAPHSERMSQLISDRVSAGMSEKQARGVKGKIHEATLDIQNPLIFDAKGKYYDSEMYSKLIDQAKTNGNDGLIIKNVSENENEKSLLGTTYAVFDDSKITEKVAPKTQGGIKTKEGLGQEVKPNLPTEAIPQTSQLENLSHSSLLEDTTKLANSKVNVDNLNISQQGKDLINKTVEEIKPTIEQSVGAKLSNSEAIKLAEDSSRILNKVVDRQSTLEWEASLLRARQKLARAAEDGKVDKEFIDNLLSIKTIGTDLGRKLQSYSIGADPKEINSMQAIIEAVLKVTNDSDTILKAAEGVDFTNLKQATDFYRKFVKPTTGEWLDLIRYNSMLSSPVTHIVNTFSNLVNSTVVAPTEKAIAGGLDFLTSKVTGKSRQAFAGESGAFLKHYFSNVKEATKRFSDVMTGKRVFTNLDTKNLPIATSGTKGKVISALSFPLRMLEGADQFFTALTESGERASLQYRKAKGVNVGNIESQAQEKAAYRLFRSDLFDKNQGHVLDAIDQLTSKLQNLRSSKNPIVSTIAKFTVPFLKTPMNIFKQGVEYSPAGFLTAIGAKNKLEQFSKAVFGSVVFGSAATLLMSNRLSWAEPINAKEKSAYRAAGKQPYSVKIGNTWYSYQKLPPVFAFPLSMVAAIDDAIKNKKTDQNTADLILSSIAKYGQFLSDQSYVKSIGDLITAASGGESGIEKLISNYPQQLIPYRALSSWIARLTDATQRKVDSKASFIDQQVQLMMMNIPGLSQKVPARLSPTGTPIKQPNPFTNAFSPIKTSTETKGDSKLPPLPKLPKLPATKATLGANLPPLPKLPKLKK